MNRPLTTACQQLNKWNKSVSSVHLSCSPKFYFWIKFDPREQYTWTYISSLLLVKTTAMWITSLCFFMRIHVINFSQNLVQLKVYLVKLLWLLLSDESYCFPFSAPTRELRANDYAHFLTPASCNIDLDLSLNSLWSPFYIDNFYHFILS